MSETPEPQAGQTFEVTRALRNGDLVEHKRSRKTGKLHGDQPDQNGRVLVEWDNAEGHPFSCIKVTQLRKAAE